MFDLKTAPVNELARQTGFWPATFTGAVQTKQIIMPHGEQKWITLYYIALIFLKGCKDETRRSIFFLLSYHWKKCCKFGPWLTFLAVLEGKLPKIQFPHLVSNVTFVFLIYYFRCHNSIFVFVPIHLVDFEYSNFDQNQWKILWIWPILDDDFGSQFFWHFQIELVW